MQRTLAFFSIAAAIYLASGGVAWAGTITAAGNVTALDDITQMPSITGQALLDEAFQGPIELDQYPGITLHTGMLADILPGVVEMGELTEPQYTSPGIYFPFPITGGGVQQGNICLSGAAITFTDPVTQFGLTAGGFVTMYITAWDQNGALIGQVEYVPEEGEAAFVGIDTMGVPIGLLTIGNDDIFGGMPYDDMGATARSDTWMWGVGDPCQSEANCLNAGWVCQAQACTNGACEYPWTTEVCDDDNACTQTDTCAEGQCLGVPVECADTNVCTFDTCYPQTGCANEPIEGCCLSDEDCPEGQMCLLGSNTCVGGPPPPPPPPEDTGTDSGGAPSETETTAAATDDGGGGGCSCSTPARDGGALFGVFALLGLLGLRRRD
jgi:MYXO-CTERM domain-containing protein